MPDWNPNSARCLAQSLVLVPLSRGTRPSPKLSTSAPVKTGRPLPQGHPLIEHGGRDSTAIWPAAHRHALVPTDHRPLSPSGQCAFGDPHGRTRPVLAIRVPAATPGQKFRPFATGTRRGRQLMRALIGPRLWPSSGRVVFGLEPSSRPQIPACSGGREVDLSRLQPIKTKYKHPIPAFFLLHNAIEHRAHAHCPIYIRPRL